MRMILFRHGPAGTRDQSRWPDDSLRPLTRRGEERTRAAAAGLALLDPEIKLILTSPLTRTDQTARLLGKVLKEAKVERADELAPGCSFRAILKVVAAAEGAKAVALVGHEPDLGKLAGTALFGAPSALPFKKAGACAIDFEDGIKPGGGRLIWFLTPKMLRRMAKRKGRS